MQTNFQTDSSDRRIGPRASLYLAAFLQCDCSSCPVKIRNLSSTGALLEGSTAVATGAPVRLVRGSLAVDGEVAWSGNGRCGINFSGRIDVQQWRTSKNAEQERVDQVVRLVNAGAVPMKHSATRSDRAADGQGFSADLQRVSALLANLEDRLAKDGVVVAVYANELQNLDIAKQIIAAVNEALNGQADPTKFMSLRKSADAALPTSA